MLSYIIHSGLKHKRVPKNLKTNTFALMQKCKTFSVVPTKNANFCNAIAAKIWQKQSYHHLTTSNVPLPLKG